jgi:hypothetical protein
MAERAAKEDAFWKEVHQHDEKEDARWESIMESVDLLFTRMDDVERNQQKLQINQDAATAALQQVLKDQATLTQHIQATVRPWPSCRWIVIKKMILIRAPWTLFPTLCSHDLVSHIPTDLVRISTILFTEAPQPISIVPVIPIDLTFLR